MTIEKVLSRVENIKPNSYDRETMIAWLSHFDLRVKAEIIDKSINKIEFNGYDANVDETIELLIPAPYDEIYVHYIMAQIDFANNEIPKYANNMSLVNSLFDNYAKKYRRENRPKGPKNYKYYGG